MCQFWMGSFTFCTEPGCSLLMSLGGEGAGIRGRAGVKVRVGAPPRGVGPHWSGPGQVRLPGGQGMGSSLRSGVKIGLSSQRMTPDSSRGAGTGRASEGQPGPQRGSGSGFRLLVRGRGSYSQRMTPSLRPSMKLSPMRRPVVPSIQARSSRSRCGSYFCASWGRGTPSGDTGTPSGGRRGHPQGDTVRGHRDTLRGMKGTPSGGHCQGDMVRWGTQEGTGR